MGAARITVMVVALVAAIGVAFLMRGVVLDKKDGETSAEAAQPMAQVLVAKKDLPIGAQIQAGDVAWEPWPAKSLNPAFITNGANPAPAPEGGLQKVAQGVQNVAVGSGQMEALYGAIVREPILIGEPIISRKIVRGGQGGYMSVVLQPGMRAIGVTVSVETGAGGFILPGDRVDVLQSREIITGGAENEQSHRVTQVVVQNVKVLAIDQKTAPEGEEKAVVGAVATLEVPANAAAALVEAKSEDQPMFLALRSYADLGGPSGVSGLAAPKAQPASVRVFRNGAVSEVAVAQ